MVVLFMLLYKGSKERLTIKKFKANERVETNEYREYMWCGKMKNVEIEFESGRQSNKVILVSAKIHRKHVWKLKGEKVEV